MEHKDINENLGITGTIGVILVIVLSFLIAVFDRAIGLVTGKK